VAVLLLVYVFGTLLLWRWRCGRVRGVVAYGGGCGCGAVLYVVA
tara:strand:+ start:25750 stop:25881 length:132 start_codon:yes stop_codon:yes gene_type:complete